MDFQTRVIEAIRSIMPADAMINPVTTIGDFRVGVCWPLHDDPDRPNKMSKTISIRMSHEAAMDFANATGPAQSSAYQRLNAFLSARLANFDPSHDTPKYQTPPVEEWIITSDVLFD